MTFSAGMPEEENRPSHALWLLLLQFLGHLTRGHKVGSYEMTTICLGIFLNRRSPITYQNNLYFCLAVIRLGSDSTIDFAERTVLL